MLLLVVPAARLRERQGTALDDLDIAWRCREEGVRTVAHRAHVLQLVADREELRQPAFEQPARVGSRPFSALGDRRVGPGTGSPGRLARDARHSGERPLPPPSVLQLPRSRRTIPSEPVATFRTEPWRRLLRSPAQSVYLPGGRSSNRN